MINQAKWLNRIHRVPFIILTLLTIYSTSVLASNDGSINDTSASSILKKLKKQPSAKMSQQDGWTIVSVVEEGNRVFWFFAPEENAEYPAVIKKTIIEKSGGIDTTITTLCEAPKAKCDTFIKQFKKMNEAYK